MNMKNKRIKSIGMKNKQILWCGLSSLGGVVLSLSIALPICLMGNRSTPKELNAHIDIINDANLGKPNDEVKYRLSWNNVHHNCWYQVHVENDVPTLFENGTLQFTSYDVNYKHDQVGIRDIYIGMEKNTNKNRLLSGSCMLIKIWKW